MAKLTSGELFVVAFVTFLVISAPWWPRLGERVAVLLSRKRAEPPDAPAPSAKHPNE